MAEQTLKSEQPKSEQTPKPKPKQEVKPKPVEMKWSILVLHDPSRTELLARLMDVLRPQVAGMDDVEIIVRPFEKALDLGTNRQAMIEQAKGTYVSQVDDDDLVADNYVSTIYPLLDGIDYIGFQLQMFMDGEKQVPTFHSLRYKEWSGDSKGWYRDISHVNPIRRDLALLVPMRGGPGEDARWAAELRNKGVVKTEHYVDSVLYLYLFRSNKAAYQGPSGSSPGPGPERVPLQQAKCPECKSTAVTMAGGMRHCNSCGHRWAP
jgi:hypothetical protein